jgi:glucosamine kinase
VWRREDENPGAWRQSALAQALFNYVGGSDWDHSKAFFYGQDRGAIGRLAVVVGQTADQDQDSVFILTRAAEELARLAQVLCTRFGVRDVVVAGRVFELHPMLLTQMQKQIASQTSIVYCQCAAHETAARLAITRLADH